MSYDLVIEEHPGYLHAAVSGAHTPENAARFLREAYAACVERSVTAILLEVKLTGPSLATGEIFKVISQSSASGKTLRKIGYVDASARDPEKLKFAETVAQNRGVNVRLFRDLAEAREWMAQ